MQGIWVKDAHTNRFSDYPLAFSNEWNSLWWMMGIQTGPLDSEWVFASGENETFANEAFAFFPTVPFFDLVYRPDVLRTLAPHLGVDEWSYFCGFMAHNEQEACGVTERFKSCDSLDAVVCAAQGTIDTLIFDIDDGLLFVWSPHSSWLDAFTACSTNWQPFDFPANTILNLFPT